MAESSTSTIPTIDLENFPAQSKKLIEACENWGCFRLINHKIPLMLMSDMKSVVRNLLDLPIEVKKRNIDVKARSGYIEPSEVNPLYESLGLYDIASLDAVDQFCAQLDATVHQRNIICAYAKLVLELAMDIATKLAESLGIVDDDPFKEWPCQFRINKYNFMLENVGHLGVQLHTDGDFLTILQEDENVGGLEVMDKADNFIPVDPLPGTFLVNIGDVGTAWSNGRFCNVKHRVQCKEASIRVSIATFLLGPKSSNVQAPEELTNNENPRLYRPFDVDDYRNLRITTNMQAGEALQLLRISAPESTYTTKFEA